MSRVRAVGVAVGVTVFMSVGVGVGVVVGVRLLLGAALGLRDRHAHVDITGGEAVALDLPHDELVVQPERLERLDQRLPREPQVEQRAEEHVAGRAGEGVEMEDPFAHGREASSPRPAARADPRKRPEDRFRSG